MTNRQKLRALRRVINAVQRTVSDYYDDPLSRYYGFDPGPPPSRIYEPIARALLQLRLSRADAVREMDEVIMLEAPHEEHDAPLAYYQMCLLHDE